MIGILGSKQEEPTTDVEKLFDVGVQFMNSGEYAYAYLCFQRSGKKDCITLYNRALCCYMISWFEECYSLLRDAEKLVPALSSLEMQELPNPFTQWEYNESPVFIPLSSDAPRVITFVQLFRLKAEAAYKLQLFNEVRSIASCLGDKYAHINKILNQIEP